MITRIIIVGCCGRMGRRIATLALEDRLLEITGAIEAKNHSDIGKDLGEILGAGRIGVKVSDNLDAISKESDVIIDFSTPTSTVSSLGIAKKAKIPIVIGTTGLMDEEMKVVTSVSSSVPVLISANMSLGVNTLFRIVPEVANILGDDYDIEIVEAHHNKKKDAPSGTAKKLAELIAEALGKELDKIVIYGREGNVGQRPKGEISIHAVRAGDIIGDHTVIFAGENERIEITHRAHSRDVFAKGALHAAKFLVDKSPGLYKMQDVIGGV